MNTRPPNVLEVESAGRSRTELRRCNVAILIFDDVEVLDFAGPFEVFAACDTRTGGNTFHVFTVAGAPSSIRATHGLKIVPDFTMENCPRSEVLVIPGGAGTRPLLGKPALVEWVRTRSRHSAVTLSVCTGALLLAKAGLLDGLRITTHADCLQELAALAPTAIIDPTKRFHDNANPAGAGWIVTAAGISAGIDASLHVVAQLAGTNAAADTARYLEYGTYAQPAE